MKVACNYAQKWKLQSRGKKNQSPLIQNVLTMNESLRNYMKENQELEGRGKVSLEIMNQPSMRYIRSLMTTNLDIIGILTCVLNLNFVYSTIFSVICSSIVGLFTGASLLSLVELFYMFIIRQYRGM